MEMVIYGLIDPTTDNSVKEASEITGISRQAITNILTKRNKKSKNGLSFEYLKEIT